VGQPVEVRVFSTAPKKPASAGFFFFISLYRASAHVERKAATGAEHLTLSASGGGGAAFADLLFGDTRLRLSSGFFTERGLENAADDAARNRGAGLCAALCASCLPGARFLEDFRHRALDDAADQLIDDF
jgi:hypothetical protein